MICDKVCGRGAIFSRVKNPGRNNHCAQAVRMKQSCRACAFRPGPRASASSPRTAHGMHGVMAQLIGFSSDSISGNSVRSASGAPLSSSTARSAAS